MRRLWIPVALAASLAVCVLPASAYGQQDEPRAMPFRRGGEERMFQMPRHEQQASQPMRRPEMAPAMQGHGRMSPEERRQLRRDIDAAGRELYPAPSRRGH